MSATNRLICCGVVGLMLLSQPAMANGWLGLTIQPPQGVQVSEIFKESPADRSGLKKGDLIRLVNDTLIRSTDHFTNTITQTQAGKEVILTVWRNGKEIKIKAILDNDADHHPLPPVTAEHKSQLAPNMLMPTDNLPPALPREQPWSVPSLPQAERLAPPAPSVWLGIASDLASGGLIIVDVAPHSPAEQADLRAGDLLIAINRQAIASPNALVQILSMMRPGDLAEVTFNREGRTLMSQVQLQKAPVNPVSVPRSP